jgi:subtilisin-like proprotein convertase family protein
MQNYTYTGAAVSIPDNNSTGASVGIAIGAIGTVADINVRVGITHTWDGDLSLSLISPAGTTVSLALKRGGSSDNYRGTLFDDEAAQSISAGSAPFAGSYRPETSLSALDGQPISGTWRLKVVDSAAADIGKINAFALEIQPLTYVCTPYAPAAVAPNVSISREGGNTTLRWTRSPADATYEVWRSSAPYYTPGDPVANRIADIGSPDCANDGDAVTCADKSMVGGENFYVVRVFNALGAWADSNRVGEFEYVTLPGD